MSQAVVYTIVATAYFLLTLVLYQAIKANENNIAPKCMCRRLGYKIPPPLFDPLVSKIERDLKNDEEYFDDDGKLNITLRLMALFPILDRAPKDGKIDNKELEVWIVEQAIDGLNFRTQQELESHDKNGDGFISFSEYLPQFSIQDIERNEMGHGEAGWWHEQFKNADADEDGTLNFDELRDFLHPEDSRNEQIHEWLLRDDIRQMDYVNNQKLDLLEFQNGAYDTFKHYVEFETDGASVPPAEDVFAKLDVNQDKLLQVDELKPILQYLSPGELSHAKHYTRFLIHEADEDGDGRLTIEEMITHDYVFYNTLNHHTNNIYDDDDDDDEKLRDEL